MFPNPPPPEPVTIFMLVDFLQTIVNLAPIGVRAESKFCVRMFALK